MKLQHRITLVMAVARFLLRTTKTETRELSILVDIEQINGKHVTTRRYNCYTTHVTESNPCK